MTREQIEKAAREYSDVIWNNDRARDISKIAFSSGALWRINSVWHKKHTVIPDTGRLCLLELKDPNSGKIVYKVDSYSGYEWIELTHYECSGLIRFAYIDDLLPKRKEEAE